MLARIEANASSRNLDSTIRVATDATPANMPAASDTTSTVAKPAPPALDDSGDAADVGAAQDGAQATVSRRHERDHASRHCAANERAESVAVREQPHRDHPEQGQPSDQRNQRR